MYPVRYYGTLHTETTADGTERRVWEGGELVMAIAYDNPVPGYDTFNTINLRLFRAAPAREFDLASFNTGDYMKAIEMRQRAEAITSVLYPADSTIGGKELRLKQQYFFVAATLRDVIRRFKRFAGWEWAHFGDKNALQLNDTHPTIAIPELMRILVDEEGVAWDAAWTITKVRQGGAGRGGATAVRARARAGGCVRVRVRARMDGCGCERARSFCWIGGDTRGGELAAWQCMQTPLSFSSAQILSAPRFTASAAAALVPTLPVCVRARNRSRHLATPTTRCCPRRSKSGRWS